MSWITACFLAQAAAAATPLNLTATPMYMGETGTFTVDGAGEPLTEAAEVWLMVGEGAGEGPCPAYLEGGCWDILSPRLTQLFVADAAGMATWDVALEAPITLGSTKTFQAAARSDVGFRMSNPVTLTVEEAPLDAADCAANPLWMPVTCTIDSWVWSSDRAYLDVPSADAAKELWTGCTHSGDGNDDGMCSLDGGGWVSVESSAMEGCDSDWYHLGGSYTGACGGHDGDTVRRLVKDPMGCYDY
jgi:hypothetical protein